MVRYLLLTMAAAAVAMATASQPAFAMEEPPPPFTATVVDLAANLRAEPTTDSSLTDVVRRGDLVYVVDVVEGEAPDGGSGSWYQLDSGDYLYSRYAAARVAGYGRWIDVDLTTMRATAMVDGEPVYRAKIVSGRPGWETPVGTFNIQKRVENETMDGATIGIPPGSAQYYYFPGVLYTQYFTSDGAALHYNYWEPESHFGEYQSSRGCVGLMLDAAAYFWDFGGLGTVVDIHY